MNLFIYILKCFLLVSSAAPTSSFFLLRRQGSLSARGIGMGPDICMWRVCIPTSESIKVKRLNWILCHKGLDIVAGKSNWKAGRRLWLQLQAKATASVWILWLNYQRMMFWWFHLHISAIRHKNKKNKKSKKNNMKRKKKVNNSNNKVGDIV